MMMLVFSGFALGEGRSANATQSVVPRREITASSTTAGAANEPRAALRAQQQARQHLAHAHSTLQTTLALYMQGESTDEQLRQASGRWPMRKGRARHMMRAADVREVDSTLPVISYRIKPSNDRRHEPGHPARRAAPAWGQRIAMTRESEATGMPIIIS
ncbi:MAG: hypothetical protein EPN65_00230 [Pandoraea sp.]|nr:MAG: hypothetical protein EPN65_00230 [Pandoraea sp.]